MANLLNAGVALIAISRQEPLLPYQGCGVFGRLEPLLYFIVGFFLTQQTARAARWMGESDAGAETE